MIQQILNKILNYFWYYKDKDNADLWIIVQSFKEVKINLKTSEDSFLILANVNWIEFTSDIFDLEKNIIKILTEQKNKYKLIKYHD